VPQNWKRPLISRREAEIRELLDEARGYHDPELVDEIACKIHDCLVVYRRAMRARIVPDTFTFSDGVTRNLTAMALSHAAAQVAEEFGDEATDMEEY
jgi:hypothetical protein